MDPMQMTWADAEQFVKAAGLDRDEYFHISTASSATIGTAELRKTVIWDEKGMRNVAVWWAPGANEGYYVHVDRQLVKGRDVTYELAMLGKFWSPIRAAFAAELLVRLFYGLFKDPNELLEAAKKSYDEAHG
jgi:hypothetical protein